MTLDQPLARHAKLFELLRQQNMAEETALRVDTRNPGLNRGDALLLQSMASASFRPMAGQAGL